MLRNLGKIQLKIRSFYIIVISVFFSSLWLLILYENHSDQLNQRTKGNLQQPLNHTIYLKSHQKDTGVNAHNVSVRKSTQSTERLDILITGPPRSGTSVFGRILKDATNTHGIWEPMNTGKMVGCNLGQKPKVHTEMDMALRVDEKGWNTYFDRLFKICREKPETRIVLKDPIALNWSDAMASRYPLQAVVKLRHPAALISSDCHRRTRWRVKNQNCPTNYIIKWLGQRIAQLKVVTRLYKKHNSSTRWYFTKHEDWCMEPVGETKKLFKFLNLDFDDRIVNTVQNLTSSSNPSETHKYHQFSLNSKKQINYWKKTLRKDQVEYIKSRTGFFWKLFYSERDWIL